MLAREIFREYDIRGIADEQLLSADVRGLGQALGTFLKRNGGARISLARDVRLSSPRLHEAILEGLLATGCEVIDLGAVPTPLLYFSVVQLKLDGGIMVTGSHNPAEFNGFKTVSGKSTIHGSQIQEVYRILSEGDFDLGKGSVRHHDIVQEYVDDVAARFSFPRRLKVVVDSGNGVGGPTMHRLLARMNVDAIDMYFEPDGRFPHHHPDPTVEHNLDLLKKVVRATKADLGVAFDGDADRIGAVDENGTVIWGDQLMLIFGREILTRKPGATMIGEVKCSQVMYDELRRLGGNAIMYKTGHSLIKAKMQETQAEMAGEMSGHLFFADGYYGFDDALYAACRLMQIVAASGRPLSHQLAGLPKLVSTPEIRDDCPDAVKAEIVNLVKAHFTGKREVSDVDGVRVKFDKGWGLVRSSNTQPILVMRFEAESAELLAAYQAEVESAVVAAKEQVMARVR